MHFVGLPVHFTPVNEGWSDEYSIISAHNATVSVHDCIFTVDTHPTLSFLAGEKCRIRFIPSLTRNA